MQGHPLGIIHGVEDLVAAVRFLSEHLNLPIISKDEASAILDNGSVSIRLVLGIKTASPIALDVTTKDLETTAAALGQLPGCSTKSSQWLTKARKVIVISTPFGIDLHVGRDFDEDELGITPDIPTELEWSADAISTIQTLVNYVPVAFRQRVREKVARRAETLSVEGGRLDVDRTLAVAALVEITPEFQLSRLRDQLSASGLDPSQFETHFER